MRVTLLAASLITFSGLAVAADMPATHPPMESAKPGAPGKHSGKVLEALPVAGYVYLRVTGAEGEEWLAAPSADIKPGATVRWGDGMVMQNYESKSLKRSFKSVRFLESVDVSK